LPDLPRAIRVTLSGLPAVEVLPNMPRAINVRLSDIPNVAILADDGEYPLYRSRTGGYYAACHCFRTAAQALKHWSPRQDARAVLFTDAIRRAES
jgi:hypothetical protein